MGWTSIPGFSKQDIVEDCIRSCGSQYIKHSIRGNHLWVLFKEANGQNIIVLFLLSGKGGTWSYKDMTESMEPYYYTCPLNFLKAAPVANQEWRNKVKMYHARNGRKFNVGETVRLLDGCSIPEVTIVSTKPLLGVYNGETYKIKKSLVDSE